jgi:hypothetical protein
LWVNIPKNHIQKIQLGLNRSCPLFTGLSRFVYIAFGIEIRIEQTLEVELVTLGEAVIADRVGVAGTRFACFEGESIGSLPTRQDVVTAYLLVVLHIKSDVTTRPPRTRYPVDGLPSGAGFTPA